MSCVKDPKTDLLSTECGFRVVYLFLLIFAVTWWCCSRPTWKGKIRVREGITYVENPARAMFAENTPGFSLDKQFQIGTEAGDSTQVFGPIQDVGIDTSGNIYILEPWGIKKYSPTGEYLSVFSKKGAGPGELNVPRFIFINRANNLFVYEINGMRISIFTSEGEFINCFKIKQGRVFDLVVDSQGNVYLGSYYKGNVIHKYSKGGKYLMSFAQYPASLQKGHELFMEGGKLAINEKDQIFLSEPDQYKIRVFDSSGALVRVISVKSNLFYPPIVKIVDQKAKRLRYEAGVSIMGLVITSNGLIVHQYLDRRNRYIFTDVFSPVGVFLLRCKETIDITTNPRGYLLAAGPCSSLIFRRMIPYPFIRCYRLKVPPFREPKF